MILWHILNARIHSGDLMVTLDRWSVYSLSRWVHTLDHIWAWFSTETIAFALWEKLQLVYEKKLNSSKLILIRQLFNMKMRKIEPTTSHINTFSRVLTELSPQGLNFEEEIKVLALLSSLPTSWEVFCTTVTNSSTKLTLDEAIGVVLSKELWIKLMGLTIDDSAVAHFSGGND